MTEHLLLNYQLYKRNRVNKVVVRMRPNNKLKNTGEQRKRMQPTKLADEGN